MTCSKSTMLKTALGLGVLSLAAYAAFPAFRTGLLSIPPVLLSLLCPLSMLFCMWGMSKRSTTPSEPEPSTESPVQSNLARARPVTTSGDAAEMVMPPPSMHGLAAAAPQLSHRKRRPSRCLTSRNWVC